MQLDDSQRYAQLNESVAAWAKKNAASLRRRVAALTLKDKIALYKAVRNLLKSPDYKPLSRSVGSALKKEFGVVSRVNFRFAKQGIWVEHGVGKGRPVRSAKARPKPWLEPQLNPAIDELAQLLADEYAALAAGEIKFTIPGIISRRVTIKNDG